MLDSINVAASGLNGHQKGLKTISNNVANMNSPGFKGSNSQFTDVFLQESGSQGNGQTLMPGGGLEVLKPTINFEAGEIRATGRDLDMALSGPGFFVVKDAHGEQLYTKAGRFEFNADGVLVTMDDGLEVLGQVSDGSSPLTSISLGRLRNSSFVATKSITFAGNLSSTAGSSATTGPDHTTDPITVYDSMGTARTLKLEFTVKRVTDPTTEVVSLLFGTWDVKVLEGTTVVGTGQYKMTSAGPDPLAKTFVVNLTALDQSTSAIDMTLADEVTSTSSGGTSTVQKLKVDGNAAGTITKTAVDETGALSVTYTNGLTVKGPKIAVAEFAAPEVLTRASGSMFAYLGDDPVRFVQLGGSTKLVGGSLELSNIDLTDQFSNMILVQRGFQASSQVLSTANEMIQSLYDLKGRR